MFTRTTVIFRVEIDVNHAQYMDFFHLWPILSETPCGVNCLKNVSNVNCEYRQLLSRDYLAFKYYLKIVIVILYSPPLFLDCFVFTASVIRSSKCAGNFEMELRDKHEARARSKVDAFPPFLLIFPTNKNKFV